MDVPTLKKSLKNWAGVFFLFFFFNGFLGHFRCGSPYANKDVVDAFARLLSALEQNQSLHKPPWPSPSFPGHRLAQAGSTCQSQRPPPLISESGSQFESPGT